MKKEKHGTKENKYANAYEKRTGKKSMFYSPPKDQHIADMIVITGPGAAHDSVNKLRKEYKYADTHAKKTEIRKAVNLEVNRLKKLPKSQNTEEKKEVRKIYKNFLDELEKDPAYRREQEEERKKYRKNYDKKRHR